MDEPQTMEMEEVVKLMNACILICTFTIVHVGPVCPSAGRPGRSWDVEAVEVGKER